MVETATMTTDLPSTVLSLRRGTLRLPAFLPDATVGVVRGVDAADVRGAGIQAVVMNTYHLMQRPGSSTIDALGGLHRMTGWDRPIVTDSGGFQIYSLIRRGPKFGRLTNKGATFQPEGAPRPFQLTPEKSIQLQLGYGSDVVICLDDCTHVDDPLAAQRASVRRTIEWARRCRAEFDRLLDARSGKGKEEGRPLIFAVVQGGGSLELRRECAEALLEIGFDGFGFGGWPLDAEGNLLTGIVGHTRALIPAHLPMHALGVGHPRNVVACFDLGYGLFDSAMPTRDARHGRLYVVRDGGQGRLGPAGDWFGFVYPADNKHIKEDAPVSPHCGCHTCATYSLGYLHHLFKLNDALFGRLATIHNLAFMAQLTDRLRGQGRAE